MSPSAKSVMVGGEDARKLMGEETYLARRNKFVSSTTLPDARITLAERRAKYKLEGDTAALENKTLWQQILVMVKALDDLNPLLRQTLNSINFTFGSGVSSLFYDWRWLILLNLLVTVLWGVFVIAVWFMNPPRFADSEPPYEYFWSRTDLSFSAMMSGSATSSDGEVRNSTVVSDSFLFYTGYVQHMGSVGEYEMGPMWVACILGTVLILFVNINGRLITALKQRRHDPVVTQLLERSGAGTIDNKVGGEGQEIVLGGYDFSAVTEEGQKGTVKALLTALESLVHGSYSEVGIPVQLGMGAEVFEIKCTPIAKPKKAAAAVDPLAKTEDGVVTEKPAVEVKPDVLQYQAMVRGELEHGSIKTDDVIISDVVLRRKLEAGKASVVATEEELKAALDAYLVSNPEASKVISTSSLPGGDEESRLQRNVVKCVLAFGTPWTIRHASVQTGRIETGAMQPSPSWVEANTTHSQTDRVAFLYTRKHGEEQDASDIAKQVVGIFLTMVLFAVSGTGVYAVTNYQEEVALRFGPYAVTLTLVIIQSVIPVVVKQIVKAEGWSSEETVLQWTLGRVYVLKMANLVVLLSQLDKVGTGDGQCATLQVGLYLYQLVIVGHITAIISNFATFYFTYRFAGPTGADKLEYDNQTVAQQYIELNYNTALVWIGYAYSPMLPFIAAVLNYAEVRALALSLKWFHKCAEKPFRTNASTKMLVMGIFFTTFAYTCFPTALFLQAHPSVLYTEINGARVATYCGPIQATERRYQVLLNFLLGWFPTFQTFLGYLTHPVLLFAVIAVLCVIIAFNYEAAGMVREECVDTHLDRINAETYLRDRRIQNRILAREKEVMEQTIASLTAKCDDLEKNNRSFLEAASAKAAKKAAGFFGSAPKDGEQPKDKQKAGSCW